MPDLVLYAYAVTPASLDASGAPAGIDDAAVGTVIEGDMAALVSSVDMGAYAPDRVELLT